MVLTQKEYEDAVNDSKTKYRIRNLLELRQYTDNFVEQTCCDRELQNASFSKRTAVHKFNNYIIHNPWKFKWVIPLTDPGWDSSKNKPTKSTLADIYEKYEQTNRDREARYLYRAFDDDYCNNQRNSSRSRSRSPI